MFFFLWESLFPSRHSLPVGEPAAEAGTDPAKRGVIPGLGALLVVVLAGRLFPISYGFVGGCRGQCPIFQIAAVA